MKDASAVGINR